MRSVLEVADFLFDTSQVALTTFRSTLAQAELDELLTARDEVNHRLQEIIDGHTEPWGWRKRDACNRQRRKGRPPTVK
jgi:regulator of protease activity HflC (stomatin/prohibitin superfamily)